MKLAIYLVVPRLKMSGWNFTSPPPEVFMAWCTQVSPQVSIVSVKSRPCTRHWCWCASNTRLFQQPVSCIFSCFGINLADNLTHCSHDLLFPWIVNVFLSSRDSLPNDICLHCDRQCAVQYFWCYQARISDRLRNIRPSTWRKVGK